MFARHALLEQVRRRNWIQHVLLVRFDVLDVLHCSQQDNAVYPCGSDCLDRSAVADIDGRRLWTSHNSHDANVAAGGLTK